FMLIIKRVTIPNVHPRKCVSIRNASSRSRIPRLLTPGTLAPNEGPTTDGPLPGDFVIVLPKMDLAGRTGGDALPHVVKHVVPTGLRRFRSSGLDLWLR